ncbi:hypothetical protein F383_14459 [Gossypium arboreum]|uniref:Uncharacterized protein n=1 Tax=Gossypium arboreum TaxID=29729 RepID=A0A0B0Q0F0_GOSAR|nr:hypothetical protein F383_14459 [Gossypium arboreum]
MPSYISRTRTQLNEFGCLVTSHELGLNSTSSDA